MNIQRLNCGRVHRNSHLKTCVTAKGMLIGKSAPNLAVGWMRDSFIRVV